MPIKTFQKIKTIVLYFVIKKKILEISFHNRPEHEITSLTPTPRSPNSKLYKTHIQRLFPQTFFWLFFSRIFFHRSFFHKLYSDFFSPRTFIPHTFSKDLFSSIRFHLLIYAPISGWAIFVHFTPPTLILFRVIQESHNTCSRVITSFQLYFPSPTRVAAVRIVREKSQVLPQWEKCIHRVNRISLGVNS